MLRTSVSGMAYCEICAKDVLARYSTSVWLRNGGMLVLYLCDSHAFGDAEELDYEGLPTDEELLDAYDRRDE